MMVLAGASSLLSGDFISRRPCVSRIACAPSVSAHGPPTTLTHLFHRERGRSVWSLDQGSRGALLLNGKPGNEIARSGREQHAAEPPDCRTSDHSALLDGTLLDSASPQPSLASPQLSLASPQLSLASPRLSLARPLVNGSLLPLDRTKSRKGPAKVAGGMVGGSGEYLSAATFPGSFLVTAIAGNDPLFQLGVAVALPVTLGIAFGIVNRPDSWLSGLRKPWWFPPGPVFGGAWGFLYPAMGVASWLVWRKGGFAKQAIPLTAYSLQLALNLLWPALFFGKKDIRLALVDIVALLCVLFFTTLLFQAVDPLAGRIMMVYLAWVIFAAMLNYSLLELNGA